MTITRRRVPAPAGNSSRMRFTATRQDGTTVNDGTGTVDIIDERDESVVVAAVPVTYVAASAGLYDAFFADDVFEENAPYRAEVRLTLGGGDTFFGVQRSYGLIPEL